MSFFGRKRKSPLHAVPQGCSGWGPSHVPLLSTSNPSPPSLSSLHSIISITQPGVNVIFCAGAALAYFLVILLGFDETFFSSVGATVTCNVVLWLGVVAFKLTFGALFAKALRIYYIFYNYRVHNKQKVGVGRDGRTHQSDGPVCYTLPALNIIMCTTPRPQGSSRTDMQARLSQHHLPLARITTPKRWCKAPTRSWCHCLLPAQPRALQDIPYPFLMLIVACLLAMDLLFLLVVTAVPCARLERERILFSVGVH